MFYWSTTDWSMTDIVNLPLAGIPLLVIGLIGNLLLVVRILHKNEKWWAVIRGLCLSKIVYPETDRETTSEKRKLSITLILATRGFLVGNTPYLLYFWAFKVTGSDRNEDFLSIADLFLVCRFVSFMNFVEKNSEKALNECCFAGNRQHRTKFLLDWITNCFSQLFSSLNKN